MPFCTHICGGYSSASGSPPTHVNIPVGHTSQGDANKERRISRYNAAMGRIGNLCSELTYANVVKFNFRTVGSETIFSTYGGMFRTRSIHTKTMVSLPA